ncbi:MAG TPA: type II toxin-antitoxin system HicB family antitoxin [Clostridiales bacterium]|jgi:predicted HicB family RNase H-like nuclease|nr:type II toxin-antitoxin system HicB family antitoxin [Clostridiales bacterium]
MSNILEYKGYFTKIEYNSEDKALYGKIEGIADLVTFESTDAGEIEKEFHNAVDDYLDFCKEIGKDPDKSYKGSFNVRIDPDLHKQLVIKAFKNNESLNQTVEKAIKEYLKPSLEVYNELCATFAFVRHIYNEKILSASNNMWNRSNYLARSNTIFDNRNNLLFERDKTEDSVYAKF